MWIHWFCYRYISNFPFDPIHIKALKCSSKGFVTLRRSVGDYVWLTHIFPNQQTFGLEITGQTNEFNELSQTQWMPLAIWTPVKGYGQVSKAFQGVCTQMWQNAVASVSGLTSCLKCWGCQSVIVPSSTLPPLSSVFCLLLFHQQSRKYKSGKKKAKRLFFFFLRCCVCLISLGRALRCRPTCRRVYCRGNKAELRRRTTSDGDSLLLPPFHRFTFLILPSFPPLIHFSLHSLSLFFSDFIIFYLRRFDVSSGLWWSIQTGRKGKHLNLGNF